MPNGRMFLGRRACRWVLIREGMLCGGEMVKYRAEYASPLIPDIIPSKVAKEGTCVTTPTVCVTVFHARVIFSCSRISRACPPDCGIEVLVSLGKGVG